ncbi:hypothetical protein HanPSC8_Chr03g0109651 [Helianthus annuus]|nr:hypothetical protein HanPSC8_Chr03g0109651 [Helianthus annuus]
MGKCTDDYSGLFFRICYAIAKHFRVIVTNIQLDWMDELGMTSLAKVLKICLLCRQPGQSVNKC